MISASIYSSFKSNRKLHDLNLKGCVYSYLTWMIFKYGHQKNNQLKNKLNIYFEMIVFDMKL